MVEVEVEGWVVVVVVVGASCRYWGVYGRGGMVHRSCNEGDVWDVKGLELRVYDLHLFTHHIVLHDLLQVLRCCVRLTSSHWSSPAVCIVEDLLHKFFFLTKCSGSVSCTNKLRTISS